MQFQYKTPERFSCCVVSFRCADQSNILFQMAAAELNMTNGDYVSL